MVTTSMVELFIPFEYNFLLIFTKKNIFWGTIVLSVLTRLYLKCNYWLSPFTSGLNNTKLLFYFVQKNYKKVKA